MIGNASGGLSWVSDHPMMLVVISVFVNLLPIFSIMKKFTDQARGT